MLDIKFVRDNPEAVKENIRKKFQNAKLPLVDEVIALDAEKRAAMNEANDLRAQRNQLSKRVGMLMGQAKKDPSKLAEAGEAKGEVMGNLKLLMDNNVLQCSQLFLVFWIWEYIYAFVMTPDQRWKIFSVS